MTPRVLVVDDLPDNRCLLVQLLEDRYEVSEAADGEEALAAVAASPPDLLVLDLTMPRMDGYQVLEALADRTTFLPVLVVTAAHERSSRLRALELGAHEFLTKPFDPEEMCLRVKTLLDLKQARAQLESRNAALEELVAERTRKLAAEKALSDRVVAGAPAAIAYLDHQLIFRRVNQAFLAMTGSTVDQILARPLHDLLRDDGRLYPGMRDVLERGATCKATEVQFATEIDGEDVHRYWDVVCEPVFGADGTVEGLILLGVDVTERVQRLDELRRIDRMKDELLSVVSHELKTPLNFITGFASILEDELGDRLTATQHRYLFQILDAAGQLDTMVDHLLDMGRMAGGRFTMTVGVEDFAAVVEGALAATADQAEKKGHQVAVDLAVPDPVPIDGLRVSQAITLLLDNAIKFTPVAGRIALKATLRDGHLVTEVTDTGPGLSALAMSRLFQRFDQLDMSATREAGGLGVGLNLVRHIVEAHGGEVGVTSTIGKGSTFWFTLPVN